MLQKGDNMNNNNISKSAKIDKFSVVKNCVIEDDVHIEQSYLEDSLVQSGTKIGPYAHLRPGCEIGKNCKIGNFCEVKNSQIGDGTKISHLAYVGDAVVGKNCNIGCGVIFVNYNGKQKNKIQIGNNVFVGSNCNLIAPLTIANNVYICAGTTVTQDLLENDFAIGRARQVVKPNRAKDYLKNFEE